MNNPDDGATDFEPDQFEDSEQYPWDSDGSLPWSIGADDE